MLQLKGYTIAERRYRTPVGEIDIVARRSNLIVAVEVKARSTYQQGLESVTPRQMQRIQRSLQYYISTHHNTAGSDCRFDVIVVKPWSWPRHVKHAWEAE